MQYDLSNWKLLACRSQSCHLSIDLSRVALPNMSQSEGTHKEKKSVLYLSLLRKWMIILIP